MFRLVDAKAACQHLCQQAAALVCLDLLSDGSTSGHRCTYFIEVGGVQKKSAAPNTRTPKRTRTAPTKSTKRIFRMRIPLFSPLRAADDNTVLQSLTRRGEWS
jgi:hypothetical protein